MENVEFIHFSDQNLFKKEKKRKNEIEVTDVIKIHTCQNKFKLKNYQERR